MASAGRKGKYDTHVKPYLSEIQKWCNSLTEEQICKRLGVGKTAWNEYKKTHSELAEAIKNGRSDLVSDLRSALIQKAKGYDYTETKVTTERLKIRKKELEHRERQVEANEW